MLEKWDIFVKELFLEILGSSGDDHALARPDDRNKIGQRLSGTRAGFHDQMPLFFERPPDGFGHLKLSSAEFICWMGARKHATGCEELIKRDALVADGRD